MALIPMGDKEVLNLISEVKSHSPYREGRFLSVHPVFSYDESSQRKLSLISYWFKAITATPREYAGRITRPNL